MNAKALDAYMTQITLAAIAANRITQYLEDYHGNLSPDDVDWADAGSMQEVAHRLEAIADMIKSKGEYAK